jgi:hypothetical protein
LTVELGLGPAVDDMSAVRLDWLLAIHDVVQKVQKAKSEAAMAAARG